MGTILLVLLVLLLVGALPAWPHSKNWGYMPSGFFSILFIVLIVLVLTGRM
jgi:asparagine N-glycosylation enzyme membrane subunit Stt3